MKNIFILTIILIVFASSCKKEYGDMVARE